VVAHYLLDVNVLLALAWPNHMHHGEAHGWFQRRRHKGFATCPLTQLGFVRISSNPKFTKDAVPPATALGLLDRLTGLREHSFWPDLLSCKEALASNQLIVGYRQLTDLYLLGLAQSHSGELATFDRSIPTEGRSAKLVEIIGEPESREQLTRDPEAKNRATHSPPSHQSGPQIP
jgi:toxin-antitoxin system PIN domain toxin